MPLLSKRSVRKEDWLPTFIERCERCLDHVEEAFETYLVSGQGEAFEASVRSTQRAEEAAIHSRPGHGGRLKPASLVGAGRDLAGAADQVVGALSAARGLLYALRCQRVELPRELAEDFAQLVDLNLEACRVLLRRFRAHGAHADLRLAGDPRILSLAQESDRLAKALVFRVFGDAPGGEGAERLLLRDLVWMTDALSGRARRAADMLDTLTAVALESRV